MDPDFDILLFAYISIHSPYTGRDSDRFTYVIITMTFQSTLPIQGETNMKLHMNRQRIFQSTLPIQGETQL
ncbi:hypothetical protein CLOSCI_02071 [[Clostridium] scindens ATCC 35704]|nr:hypothetical protein CLOSCI_02071 [[Clostridium] scindens ATCC 35704]